MSCAFCEIVAGRAPAVVVAEWADALAFVPLNPVAPGPEEHVLVIPKAHVVDFIEDDEVCATVNRRASQLAKSLRQAHGGDQNKITSAGPWATQTVPHYHEHLVIRRENDGLALPWTGQAEREAARSAPPTSWPQAERQCTCADADFDERPVCEIHHPTTEGSPS